MNDLHPRLIQRFDSHNDNRDCILNPGILANAIFGNPESHTE